MHACSLTSYINPKELIHHTTLYKDMYKYIRLITHTRNREKPTAHSCCDTCRCTIMQELVRIKLTFWYYGKYTSVILLQFCIYPMTCGYQITNIKSANYMYMYIHVPFFHIMVCETIDTHTVP